MARHLDTIQNMKDTIHPARTLQTLRVLLYLLIVHIPVLTNEASES